MSENPETANKPVVSQAVQDILADQFSDELARGKRDHPNGTDSKFVPNAVVSLGHLKQQAIRGRMTFTDLILAQAFETAARTDPKELRRALVQLGATTVQWIEALDRRAGGV